MFIVPLSFGMRRRRREDPDLQQAPALLLPGGKRDPCVSPRTSLCRRFSFQKQAFRVVIKGKLTNYTIVELVNFAQC